MEAAALAPIVVEAEGLPNHKTRVTLVVPAAAVVVTMAEGFHFCREVKLSRGAREVAGKLQVTTDL